MKSQTANQHVDVSSDVTGYKQAVDKLSASISTCVGSDLLSEEADVVMHARELEKTMQKKLKKTIKKAEQMLFRAVFTAETTREWAPLASYLDTLVADEVLRQSCGEAVESAENLLTTLRAEEQERMAVVSVQLHPLMFAQCSMLFSFVGRTLVGFSIMTVACRVDFGLVFERTAYI